MRQRSAFEERALRISSPNMGEGREGEAALRCETIFARFPHPDPPPCRGRGLQIAALGSIRRETPCAELLD
jgi:hypothetical protein